MQIALVRQAGGNEMGEGKQDMSEEIRGKAMRHARATPIGPT